MSIMMNTTLPIGWLRDGQHLQRSDRFPTFRDAMAFVNAVAELAEQQNHHPDITINYCTVSLRVTTHDAGKLTDKDYTLAEAISLLLIVQAR